MTSGGPMKNGAMAAVVAAFVVLGLPDGALGVAWPSMRADFDRSLGDLGWIVLALTVGYLTVTASTGWLARRFGTARLGGSGAAVLAVGLGLLAVAPWWPLTVLAAWLWGVGGGALDAGLNADVALRADGRTMGLLHAGYGLGAAGGPLLTAGSITAGAGWRPAYALLAAACLVGVVAGRRLQDQPNPPTRGSSPAAPKRRVLIGATAFFVYVCLELGAGHWAFTALTEADGMAPAMASMWVASYWAAMTVGRLWLGLAGHRLGPRRVLGGSVAGAIMGAVLLTAGVASGLPVLGASLASIFPTLVMVTPSRVGGEQAAGAIGWQMAAAGAGGAAGPAAVGVLLERAGVDAYGPLLLVLAVLLAVAIAAVNRSAAG